MTYEKPELVSEGVISLPKGRRLVFDPDKLSPEIEEFYSEGLNAKLAWGNENLFRIHLKANEAELSTTFIIK